MLTAEAHHLENKVYVFQPVIIQHRRRLWNAWVGTQLTIKPWQEEITRWGEQKTSTLPHDKWRLQQLRMVITFFPIFFFLFFFSYLYANSLPRAPTCQGGWVSQFCFQRYWSRLVCFQHYRRDWNKCWNAQKFNTFFPGIHSSFSLHWMVGNVYPLSAHMDSTPPSCDTLGEFVSAHSPLSLSLLYGFLLRNTHRTEHSTWRMQFDQDCDL